MWTKLGSHSLRFLNSIIHHISRLINQEQNKALMRLISLMEVEEIVKNMPLNKAPSLEGFTIDFYQACWRFMGNEIHKVLEESP